MLTLENFLQKLEDICPDFREIGFLLAVSGGADSMVLAHLFKKARLNFQIAHVNYELRGEDSDSDQDLVAEFSAKNLLKLHLYKVSDKDAKPSHSVQIWARNLRYAFFSTVQKKENLKYLVTAHHLNDQLETFLINLSRGSGIKGLCGIPADENHILRPLLQYTKEEIYEFAEKNRVAFREDASNAKNDYLRNRVRNKIIPEFTEISDEFIGQFGNSVTHLKAANRFIQNTTENVYNNLRKSGNDEHFVLDKEKLMQQDPFIVGEIIRKLGFSGAEIEKVISAENGKFFRSKSHEIQISRTEISCRRKPQK